MVASAPSVGAMALPSICGRLCRIAHQARPNANAAQTTMPTRVHRSQRSHRMEWLVLRDAQDGHRVRAPGDTGELTLGDDDELALLHEFELQHHREDGLEQLVGA